MQDFYLSEESKKALLEGQEIHRVEREMETVEAALMVSTGVPTKPLIFDMGESLGQLHDQPMSSGLDVVPHVGLRSMRH